MDIIKTFSRRAFFRIFIYFFLLCAIVFLSLFAGVTILKSELPELIGINADSELFPKIAQLLASAEKHLFLCVLPTMVLFFLVSALGLWSGLRKSFRKLAAPSTGKKRPPAAAEERADKDQLKAQARRLDRQLYLYLLSLLQREGRLIDFLAEDLSLYEDAQIGAAVRGIHESCKKVIDKNLSPKPIIDKTEGDTVTIEPGFNPAAVKLVGNVSGDPPFQGVLRHRGWQSKKEELPTLSGTQDEGILAPAEVELM